jgi:hypothetical protein
MGPKLAAAVLLLAAARGATGAALESPEQFAGFRVGADRKLVRWDRIVEYMKQAAAASPRVRFEETGKTTNGFPFILVTVSSPETIASLPRYREMQRRLVYSRGLSDGEAQQLMDRQKAIVLITCNIHSTEIGSSQMTLELVHRLATEDTPFIHRILDNVILLLVPSLNPDGQILVTDWYNRNVGTPYEFSPLPELYHKYTGHDDNRDAFMNTQVESRLINRITYKDWMPHVFFDEHQMGNSGPRIFVPPFKNPINQNVDPLIWELNGLMGYSMGAALHQKGYTGIINDAIYTSWWQGGFVMQAWWHNMVGLLTEVASVNIASPVEQDAARLNQVVPGPPEAGSEDRNRDPRRPLPPPRDVTARNTYPRPWLGGRWALRDIVDYELTATFAALDSAASNRSLLIRSVYQMNHRQMELGAGEAPYAWVIPAGQHDPPAAARLLQILDEQGVEVQKAITGFEAEGRKFPAGSHVVLMAQPYRAFAKDLLEKQSYPAQRAAPDGPVERPYDVTGWTLPLQMGVEAVEAARPFPAKLERVGTIPVPAGRFEATRDSAGFRISHATNNASIVTNRLLRTGREIGWLPDGGIFVGNQPGVAADLEKWSRELGVDVGVMAPPPPAGLRRLRQPRLGLYKSKLPVMDEGWMRWLLETYEFPYISVADADFAAGNLNARFDAIVLPEQAKNQLLNGTRNEWVRPEHRGGIGAEGVAALKSFVRGGGTLIALGNSSLLPVEEFPLPLKSSLRDLKPGQFSCPGSILRVFVDTAAPEGYGMKPEASAVFYNNVAFDPAPALGDAAVRVIARYPGTNLLQSGWIGGEEFLRDRIAAAEVTVGQGRVILLGFAVQNRAQPHGTFKLLFNSIHLAGAGL